MSQEIIKSLEFSPRLARVYEIAVEKSTSPSHDQYHIDKVLIEAKKLSRWCIENDQLVNEELLWAACCLHDLGRNNPELHGLESIRASIDQARPILLDCGFNFQEIKYVSEIVRDHDQPDAEPKSIEGFILGEADILAGLGAWGILRIGLWTGESGRSIDDIIIAIRERMPARIASLKLPPSRETAACEWEFAREFLDRLERQMDYSRRRNYPLV